MNKYNSVMWVQNEDLSQADFLIVNTKLIKNEEKECHQKAFDVTNRVIMSCSFDKALINNHRNATGNIYFRLGTSLFKGILFRSCFAELQKNDEKYPFLFWNSNCKAATFVENLVKSASELGKTITKEDKDFLNKFIKRVRLRRIFSIALVLIVLALLII